MTSQYWIVTIALFLVIVVTRALPFMFSHVMSEQFTRIGKLLPGYIMLCLVIYEIDPKSLTHSSYGLPDIIGLLVVLLIFKTMHNVILSLIFSFIAYMLCRHWLG